MGEIVFITRVDFVIQIFSGNVKRFDFVFLEKN